MTPAAADTPGYTATLVLQALSLGHRYGFEIMRITDLPSGTVYPILRRLEGQGLARSAWEDEDEAHSDRRPARRYYQLTPEGGAHWRRRDSASWTRAACSRPTPEGRADPNGRHCRHT